MHNKSAPAPADNTPIPLASTFGTYVRLRVVQTTPDLAIQLVSILALTPKGGRGGGGNEKLAEQLQKTTQPSKMPPSTCPSTCTSSIILINMCGPPNPIVGSTLLE